MDVDGRAVGILPGFDPRVTAADQAELDAVIATMAFETAAPSASG